jgi:hypothetical protein
MTVDRSGEMLSAVSRLASRIRGAPNEIAAASILRCALFLAITHARASSALASETLQLMERAAVETLAMLHPSVVAAPTDTMAVSSIAATDKTQGAE